MKAEPLACPPLPPGRPNLVLTGFMGTGKSTVGRAVAAHLRMPFFDLDQEVERSAGHPVAELIRSLGEAGFRQLESRAMAEAVDLSGAVIATGGGAVLHELEYRQLSSTGVAVVLTCAEGELERRLAAGGSSRPLISSGALAVRRLLAHREPAYAGAGEAVDTTGAGVAESAAEVAGRYRRLGGRAAIGAGPGSVVVFPGAVTDLGTLARSRLPGCERAVVVSDGNVAAVQGRECAAALRRAGMTVTELTVAPGEAAKRLPELARLWRRLGRAGVDRQDVVVAVGGGAALDLVGMAAATYARGLPLVNVPTTLLGMADAAVGGKVAIDLGRTKNAVGCFHQAALVVCDPTMLRGLPPAVLRQGLAEILKCALLGSPLVAANFGELAAATTAEQLAFLVEQAVRVKLAYVGADPTDRGLRLALNLGHTFAHGLESASRFTLSHGEAVAVGLVAAARLGAELGLSPAGLPSSVQRWVEGAGLPSAVPEGISLSRVERAWAADKKRRSGLARWVVPGADGVGAQLVSDLPPQLARVALAGAAKGGSPVPVP